MHIRIVLRPVIRRLMYPFTASVMSGISGNFHSVHNCTSFNHRYLQFSSPVWRRLLCSDAAAPNATARPHHPDQPIQQLTDCHHQFIHAHLCTNNTIITNIAVQYFVNAIVPSCNSVGTIAMTMPAVPIIIYICDHLPKAEFTMTSLTTSDSMKSATCKMLLRQGDFTRGTRCNNDNDNDDDNDDDNHHYHEVGVDACRLSQSTDFHTSECTATFLHHLFSHDTSWLQFRTSLLIEHSALSKR